MLDDSGLPRCLFPPFPDTCRNGLSLPALTWSYHGRNDSNVTANRSQDTTHSGAVLHTCRPRPLSRARAASVMSVLGMGAESGRTGDASPSREISGDVSRNNYILVKKKIDTNLAYSNIFKIKWPKSEDKRNFEGRRVWVPTNPSPQSKLCDGALGSRSHAWINQATKHTYIPTYTAHKS